MQRIGQFGLYEGLMIVSPNGSIYREVTREDIRAKKTVLEVKVAGLEYVPDVAQLGKPILILDPPLEGDTVRHGPTDGLEVLRMTPQALLEFMKQMGGRDEEEKDISQYPYVIYARKSTGDPKCQARSLPDQVKECRRIAESRGIKIVKIITEPNRKVPKSQVYGLSYAP